MAKIRFSNKHGEEYNIPSLSNLLKCSKHEALVIFDSPEVLNEKQKTTPAKLCVGVGTVVKVQKGEKLDIVMMNFGRRYARKILVFHNHARRQVYTLKRGSVATFYGLIRIYRDSETTEWRVAMYAFGFQCWFLPKVMDIKTYDTDMLEELTKENETSMLNFLDEIMELGDNKDDI